MLVAFLLLSLSAQAQIAALELAELIYISINDVARAAGYPVTETGDQLVLETERGQLTLFHNSPQVHWRLSGEEARELPLKASVLRRGEVWYAPAEVFDFIGLQTSSSQIQLSSGASYTLSFPLALTTRARQFETIALENNVSALNFYETGSAGDASISLMLVDLELLALAYPQQQSAVDHFINTLEQGRPLYFVVTAIDESPWETTLSFQQGNERFVARHPFSLSVLEGEAGTVSPDKPVSGVVLLPRQFNLRETMTIEWASIRAEFRFRR